MLSQVELSHSGKCLFVGTSTGNIRSIRYPLTEATDFKELNAHGSLINRIRLSFDDKWLFSCSDDGCIYFFKVEGATQINPENNSEFQIKYMDEILGTRSDIDEVKVNMM